MDKPPCWIQLHPLLAEHSSITTKPWLILTHHFGSWSLQVRQFVSKHNERQHVFIYGKCLQFYKQVRSALSLARQPPLIHGMKSSNGNKMIPTLALVCPSFQQTLFFLIWTKQTHCLVIYLQNICNDANAPTKILKQNLFVNYSGLPTSKKPHFLPQAFYDYVIPFYQNTVYHT